MQDADLRGSTAIPASAAIPASVPAATAQASAVTTTNNIVFASTSLQAPVILVDEARGYTLAELVESAIEKHGVPRRFKKHGHIEIGGHRIPRDKWRVVRPKDGHEVRLYLTHAGGGEDSGKNIFAAIAAVLLVVVTGGIAAGGLVALGASAAAFGAGTLGATVAAGLVGLAGQLAINALFAPPQEEKSKDAPIAKANSSGIGGNALAKGETIPRVLGTFRTYPPMLMQPRSYLIGDDVYTEAIFALAGPHQLEDIQINGASIDSMNGVTVTLDDGAGGTRTNSFTAYAHTDRLSQQLSKHRVRNAESGYNDRALVEQGANAINSLPQWHRFTTRAGCDYADVFLTFGGLWDAEVPDGADAGQVVYLRMRARKEGDTAWKNIGTIPYVGYGSGTRNRRIRLYFKAHTSETGGASNVNAFRTPVTLPVVDVDHVEFKTTDSDHFPAAYSFDWVRQREGIDCYLNNSYFFDGSSRYEFEIKRSEMVAERFMTTVSTMQRGNGDYLDYCDANDGGTGSYYRITEDAESKADAVILQSVSSVFLGSPIPSAAEIATIQLQVKNIEIANVSVLASGLVPTWSGSAWTGSSVSTNPAAHFRYILTGGMTSDPISAFYLSGIAAWYVECEAQGYNIGTVFAGAIEDALDLAAACGFARKDIGLTYGVVYFHDTSDEVPTQLFSARNIRNLSWVVPYSLRPESFACRFYNAAKNYEPDEYVVDDPNPIPGGSYGVESVSYDGLTTQGEVRARALFDFRQARNATRYTFEIGIEYLATSRGEIAILSHDALQRQVWWSRITSIDSATQLRVDDFPAADAFAGYVFIGALVRNADNDVVTLSSVTLNSAAETITVSSTANLDVGDLIVFGPLEVVEKRVQVLAIEPLNMETARVTVQDEFLSSSADYKITAAPGSIALTGQTAELTSSNAIQPEAGTFSLGGQTAELQYLGLSAESGSFALSGQEANLLYDDGSGYSFNLTAGDYFGALQGYSDGSLIDAFGSIDADPVSGHALAIFVDGASASIVFDGDCVTELSGKTVWIDSVEYPFSNDWAYDSENGYTVADWGGGSPPDFTDSSTYLVEIK